MSAKKAKRLRAAVLIDVATQSGGVFTDSAVNAGRIAQPSRKQLARAIRQELKRQSSTPVPAVGETSST